MFDNPLAVAMTMKLLLLEWHRQANQDQLLCSAPSSLNSGVTMTELTAKLIEELQTIDTPTVCMLLKWLHRSGGYGYSPAVGCTRPELRPMVGVARTATIRSAHPSSLRKERVKRRILCLR